MVSQCGLVKGEGQSIIILQIQKITENSSLLFSSCHLELIILEIVTFLVIFCI